MRTLDLNCDLGEGEPTARTRALMRWITSANVACGGHAGDAGSMRVCVRLAKEFGVKLGAHPGPRSRVDQGRSPIRLTPAELELLLLQQVSALCEIAFREGVALHHVKLHGALYHAVEAELPLAKHYLHCVKKYWPELKVYAQAGGTVMRAAKAAGVRVLAEGFADRAYHADGLLVSRTEPGALLEKPAEIVSRVRDLLAGQGVPSIDGPRLKLKIDTLCVHSDSPNSVAIVRALARLIR